MLAGLCLKHYGNTINYVLLDIDDTLLKWEFGSMIDMWLLQAYYKMFVLYFLQIFDT